MIGADLELIRSLDQLEDASINAEREFQVLNPEPDADRLEAQEARTAEWGMEKIQAAEAIAALSTNRTGAVVGILAEKVESSSTLSKMSLSLLLLS